MLLNGFLRMRRALNTLSKNVPEPDTVEEVVDAASFKVEADRTELGAYNEYLAR
jgi:hypothetical protein